jgi:hypothetical protein
MVITKLVECPVVDSVPFLSLVLYRGHTYSFWEGWTLFLSAGWGRRKARKKETGLIEDGSANSW